MNIRVGWRGESYRHYLASKGIKSAVGGTVGGSRRYYAPIGLLDDRDGDNEQKMFRQRNEDVLRNEIIGKLQEKEAAGQLRPEATERFMKNVFAKEAGFYRNGTYDHQRFKDEVNHQFDVFTQNNATSLSAFDWAKKGES